MPGLPEAAVLGLSAFLALAQRCAPGVAPGTLADIARTESGFDALALNVNGKGGGTVRVSSREDAIAKARALMAAGRSIDLGLMQINGANLGWLGLSVDDAFDPCRSIAAGAQVLTAYSRYNTGHPTRGIANGYVGKVLASRAANAATDDGTAAAGSSPVPAPQATPAFAPGLGRGAGGRDFSYQPLSK